MVHAIEMNTPILIGPRLKLARKAACLSQKEIAALCGIGQSHISAMERNARAPSIEILASLAAALGVTSHWLLGGDSEDTLGDTETGRAHILADSRAAPGLESLAGDATLCTGLDIQPTEWLTLRSLATPHPISKDGYVAMLMVLRGHRLT
jgi:transcriptional regulator with XRE-family HTH domain